MNLNGHFYYSNSSKHTHAHKKNPIRSLELFLEVRNVCYFHFRSSEKVLPAMIFYMTAPVNHTSVYTSGFLKWRYLPWCTRHGFHTCSRPLFGPAIGDSSLSQGSSLVWNVAKQAFPFCGQPDTGVAGRRGSGWEGPQQCPPQPLPFLCLRLWEELNCVVADGRIRF